jgi:hypothetical protein
VLKDITNQTPAPKAAIAGKAALATQQGTGHQKASETFRKPLAPKTNISKKPLETSKKETVKKEPKKALSTKKKAASSLKKKREANLQKAKIENNTTTKPEIVLKEEEYPEIEYMPPRVDPKCMAMQLTRILIVKLIFWMHG